MACPLFLTVFFFVAERFFFSRQAKPMIPRWTITFPSWRSASGFRSTRNAMCPCTHLSVLVRTRTGNAYNSHMPLFPYCLPLGVEPLRASYQAVIEKLHIDTIILAYVSLKHSYTHAQTRPPPAPCTLRISSANTRTRTYTCTRTCTCTHNSCILRSCAAMVAQTAWCAVTNRASAHPPKTWPASRRYHACDFKHILRLCVSCACACAWICEWALACACVAYVTLSAVLI